MGQTQSAQTADGVAITSNAENNTTEDGYFGVRVVDGSDKPVVKKTDVELAYERGRDEAREEIHRHFAVVANQVYDNVQEQLDAIERTQLESAKKTIATLHNKVETHKPMTPVCVVERAEVVKCLQNNPNKSLACRIYAEAFSNCASKELESSLKDSK